MNKAMPFPWVLALIMIVGLLLISLLLGTVDISFSEIVAVVKGKSESASAEAILLQSRLPRGLTAILVGMSLALSGLLMQTLFHNPLAGPSVLGISSGASLGVGLVTLTASAWGISSFTPSPLWGALMGSAIVLVLILWVAKRLRSALSLLIFGLMLGYVTSSILGMLQYSGSQEALRSFVVWGLGSFERTQMLEILWLFLVLLISLIIIWRKIPSLNALTLGESYAASMGVKLAPFRWLVIALAGVLTAISTAYCGPVAFLGLAVPHVARMIWKAQNMRVLLPATLLSGAFIGLFCDVLCRLPFFEGSLPLNAVTSLVGAPVIVAIIWSGNKWRTAQ